MNETYPSAAESRLSAFWPAAAGVLVIALVMGTIYFVGRTRRLQAELAQSRERLEAARTHAAQLEAELQRMQQTQARLQTRLEQLAAAGRRPQLASQPSPQRTGSPQEPPAARRVVLDEASIVARLNVALRPRDGTFSVADAEAARRLLADVAPRVETLSLRPATWAQLAVLAELLGSPLADTLAGRAGPDTPALAPLWWLRAEAALRARQYDEARTWTARLVAAEPQSDRAHLFDALAAFGAGDRIAASHAFEAVDPSALHDTDDQIAYGRLAVALERFDALERVLATIRTPTTQPSDALLFLRAAALVHAGRTDEGRALIETLLERDPQSYELRVWRAIALIQSGQYEAAREALRFADQYPTRPEAWYWRAMVEIRAGNEQAATPFLSEALAASESYAPAWEALGVLALNRGDVRDAVDYLTQAIRTGPQRATSHLLLAIAYARLSRREDVLRELRTAVRLDRSLVARAREAPVLRALLTRRDFEQLATSAPSTQPRPVP